ncbi:protein NYNRIN-like [Gossypium australe]|uniref:Protein NYNRIN-like n=1 Tax=Gossypium australe TaxID=47621 RepID=A0A5B6W8Y2_9ROSI|nr:protein NYNRIN-like [Gossypium australe]
MSEALILWAYFPILSVIIDYVSEWVEAVALLVNDTKAVVQFLHKNIFSRFETSRALVSDEGSHFCSKK